MSEKKIFIGSDHGGFALKTHLVKVLWEKGFKVVDVGPECEESCDYPLFAQKVAEHVLDGKHLGILICGTGLGMSMAANRFRGIRAAMCTNEYMARMARAHNDANILCMGERTVGIGLAESILDAFLESDFEGDRHLRRINLIEDLVS